MCGVGEASSASGIARRVGADDSKFGIAVDGLGLPITLKSAPLVLRW